MIPMVQLYYILRNPEAMVLGTDPFAFLLRIWSVLK